MEEILHYLGWLKGTVNNGVLISLGGAGFCPSTWASACNRQISGRFPAQRVYEQRTQRTEILFFF